jgi:hypothetical protein
MFAWHSQPRTVAEPPTISHPTHWQYHLCLHPLADCARINSISYTLSWPHHHAVVLLNNGNDQQNFGGTSPRHA